VAQPPSLQHASNIMTNKRKIIFSIVIILFLSFSIIDLSSAKESLKNREGNLNEVLSCPAPNTFSFAYLGDCRHGVERFESIVRDINSHHPSFFVVNGDMVCRNTEREYCFYVHELEEEREGLPVFHAVGNHDIEFLKFHLSRKRFKNFFGATYYWFSFQNSLFIVLDDADDRIDAEQFQWLKNILETKRGSFTHTFVFMHIPPFDYREGHHHCMKDKKEAEDFMRLMERYKVTRVFCSHIHAYHREVTNGIPYIISGGGGASMAIEPPFYHYILIEVKGDRVTDRPIEIDNVRSVEDKVEYLFGVDYPPSSPVFWAIILSLVIIASIPIIIVIRKIRKRSKGSKLNKRRE